MNELIKISVLPPSIKKFFSKDLLKAPYPGFYDSCITIQKMLNKVLKIWHKLDSNSIRKARCEKLKQEILNLYERAKIKEKERESETDHKTKEFGYSFAGNKRISGDIYWRLKFGRKKGAHSFNRRNNEI